MLGRFGGVHASTRWMFVRFAVWNLLCAAVIHQMIMWFGRMAAAVWLGTGWALERIMLGQRLSYCVHWFSIWWLWRSELRAHIIFTLIKPFVSYGCGYCHSGGDCRIKVGTASCYSQGPFTLRGKTRKIFRKATSVCFPNAFSLPLFCKSTTVSCLCHSIFLRHKYLSLGKNICF